MTIIQSETNPSLYATTITEHDLLNELATEFTRPPLLPDDVTAPRLARKMGITEKTAKTRLEKKVEAGELVKMKLVNEYGREVTAYRKA